MSTHHEATIDSQIEMRCTTHPECLGYAGSKANAERAAAAYFGGPPHYTGTPAEVLAEAIRWKTAVGNCYKRVDFTYDGQEVDIRDLEYIVNMQD